MNNNSIVHIRNDDGTYSYKCLEKDVNKLPKIVPTVST